MKSLCTAAWLLTVAFGNMVVVIVAESTIFSNQVCASAVGSTYCLTKMSLIHSRHTSSSFLLLL